MLLALKLPTLLRTFSISITKDLNKVSIFDPVPVVPPAVTNSDFTLKSFRGTRKSRRAGVLAIKVGMTHMWDKWGKMHPLTVLQIDRCQVVQIKTVELDGYNAIQLGVGEKPLHLVTKPMTGHFIKADVPPKKALIECKVTSDCLLPLGYELTARHFVVGQYVDILGISKGKGFQGGIKRWNFNRQPASHGNTLTTRKIGSTGNRKSPARTFPGKKMPGRLGGEKSTKQNALVYKIDAVRNLMYVIGPVPGNRGGVVRIVDAVKDPKLQHRKLPFPTFLAEDGKEYPAEEVMDVGEKDYFETIYLHDNVVPNIKEDD